MTPITQYRADDGTVFTTELAAFQHASLCMAVAQAMHPMGKRHPQVESGKAWVHHNLPAVAKAKRDLLQLALPVIKACDAKLATICDEDPQNVHPGSMVGRILSDHGGPLNAAWHRIWCTDSEGREHQQPYFAINGPDKAHVCVEDRR